MRFSSSLSILVSISIACASTTFAREQESQQEQQHQQQQLRRPNTNTNRHHGFEAREQEPGVFSVSVTTPSDDNYGDSNAMRQYGRRAQVAPRKLEDFLSCRLYQEDVYYPADDSKNTDDRFVCTFEHYVNEDGGVPYPYTVEFYGDVEKTKRIFKRAGVVSGQSILRWESAGLVSIDKEDNTLAMNINNNINTNIVLSKDEGRGVWIDVNEPDIVDDEDTDDESRRKLQLPLGSSTRGNKRTLVIRIVGNGTGPKANISQLREEIFGTGVSLTSQMESCSHGQMTIEPFSGPTNGGYFKGSIVGGVIELRITTDPHGKTDKRMENDANSAAYYVLGDLGSQFDLVLFAMPPGITPGFAAYAYIGSPFSYYSNESIEDVMVQMHEVGHNLGLQHAGERLPGEGAHEEYGDPSGYMGYSSTSDPRMCYNAANNYQLGWYSQYSITPTSANGYGGTFVISGVAGYNVTDDSKFVSLRLEQETLTADYYIGYNWKFGMNVETQEDADKVIIVEKDGGIHESVISWKKAALSVGESYVIENYDNSGRSVTITFSNIDANDAVVDIIPESSESPSSSPSLKPSASPSGSSSPSLSPSASSSASPSLMPSASPSGSSSPSLSPSAFNETDLFDLIDSDNNETDNNETVFFDFNETDFFDFNETDTIFDSNETDNIFDSNETDNIFDSNETDNIFDSNETVFPSDGETTWYPTTTGSTTGTGFFM